MTKKSVSWMIRIGLIAAVGIAALRTREMVAESIVPVLFLVVMLVTLALGALATHRQRRMRFRLRHGLCMFCGYDLRASPERCPECGVAVPEGHGDALSREHMAGRGFPPRG
jgi:hypothetical protein